MQIVMANPKIKSVDFTSQGLIGLLEAFIGPLMAATSTLIVLYSQSGKLQITEVFLSVIVFFLFKPFKLKIDQQLWRNLLTSIYSLIFVSLVVVALKWSLLNTLFKQPFLSEPNLHIFTQHYKFIWLGLTPLMQMLGIEGLKWVAKKTYKHKKVVFIGSDRQANQIALNLSKNPYSESQVEGFFEDRSSDRIPEDIGMPLLGKFDDVASYVNLHKIDSVYISLPMTKQKRMLSLIESLKDTTATVYFIPDMFITELIQARVVLINGSLVISVCDTPFVGLDGFIKRLSDIIFSGLILTLISPVLLVIGVAIKLESKGPVIFKQSRYGINGEEVKVYKFRSMKTLDNGAKIKQAEKNDPRFTRLGAFLRRTSLDELPQFINVIQGRMSIVGPRPHAVAHNEEYRKVISGYMLRHMARPGITGLAQVNGYRGETRTTEMMQKRVEYDIKYLQNWSIWLDTFIILKTIFVVLKKEGNAY